MLHGITFINKKKINRSEEEQMPLPGASDGIPFLGCGDNDGCFGNLLKTLRHVRITREFNDTTVHTIA